MCGGRNRFIQRCREAYDICSVSSGRDDAEELLVSAKAKKRSLLADKITGDNIYKALIFFDKLYAQMNEAEKREFLLSCYWTFSM